MPEREFRILRVEYRPDDQDIVKERIALALNGHEFYTKKAETYNEAYESLSGQDHWDLLITDMSLGENSEAIRRKKKYQNYELKGNVLLDIAGRKQIPVIIVTAAPLSQREVNQYHCVNKIRGFFLVHDFDRSLFIDKVKEVWENWDAHQSGEKLDDLAMPISQSKTIHNPIQEPTNMHFYALLIGVANYRHVRPLAKTTNDVDGLFKTLLKNGYSSENISILKDGDATKNNISQKLDWLASSTKKEDTAIIFFSGHGMRSVGGFSPGEYLCPVEANLDQLKESCISSEEFTTALRAIHADRLVVFLDSCHSGGVGQARDANLNLQEGLSQQTYDQIAQSENGKGRVIIASCLPNEVSWELTDWKNGLFTHYLLEGLNGAAADSDGKVRIMGLSGYISRNVPNHGQEQHPFIQLAAQDFVVAINPNSQSPVTEETLREEIAPTQTVVQETASTIKNQNPTRQQKNELCQKILDAYDEDTFEGLCNNMGVVYSDLHGARNFENKIFKLITKCIIEGLYEDLVVTVCNRPYFTRQNT
jgi:uncharacterized caspase-like protein/CheY-like chemotaxis protein